MIFLCPTSAISNSRLLLARLPATAGIVTEVPKGRLFGGSLGSHILKTDIFGVKELSLDATQRPVDPHLGNQYSILVEDVVEAYKPSSQH